MRLPSAFSGFGVRRLPHRPRFREGTFGRTWDTATVTFQHANGEKFTFTGRIDTTWGSAVTFTHEGSWYSASILYAHDDGFLNFRLVKEGA